MNLLFQNKDDEKYFIKFFGVKDLAPLMGHFDFRPVKTKREEFNRIHKKLFKQLVKRDGETCWWRFDDNCMGDKSLQIDHLIPLSSNKLNKELRHLKPSPGRKVPTQSLGSNNLINLVLACKYCNGHKKHRILPLKNKHLTPSEQFARMVK